MEKCCLLPHGWRLRETEHLQSNCCCRIASTAFAFIAPLPAFPGRADLRFYPPSAPRPPPGVPPARAGRCRKVSPAPPRPPRRPRYPPFSSAPALPMVAECGVFRGYRARFASCRKPRLEPRRLTARGEGVPGGGGGLPSPPGDAAPPGDAQTALIKKLNTAAAATASSSSLPAPFHRYSAALLSNLPPPAFARIKLRSVETSCKTLRAAHR